MRKIDAIRECLETALGPLQLKIIDESAHHAGHAEAGNASETHFRVEIISRQFTPLSRVERHRLVYSILSSIFAEGLHAIEIIAKAPGE